jgi:hypothetical protein
MSDMEMGSNHDEDQDDEAEREEGDEGEAEEAAEGEDGDDGEDRDTERAVEGEDGDDGEDRETEEVVEGGDGDDEEQEGEEGQEGPEGEERQEGEEEILKNLVDYDDIKNSNNNSLGMKWVPVEKMVANTNIDGYTYCFCSRADGPVLSGIAMETIMVLQWLIKKAPHKKRMHNTASLCVTFNKDSVLERLVERTRVTDAENDDTAGSILDIDRMEIDQIPLDTVSVTFCLFFIRYLMMMMMSITAPAMELFSSVLFLQISFLFLTHQFH